MSDQIETEGDWHWRNSMKTVKFFGLDARAASAFFMVMLHIRLWTIYLCVVIVTIFHIMSRRGYTFPSALRALRSWVVGDDRPAWMYIRKNKLVDYG
ncbi:MAG: type IV secretion protein IcmT [Micavibrio sp.]|jgi:intracellular multiplication protein IcmT|nr:type IV secretion protein IcmT [Micavibrio sp.]HCK33032.1 type IV secretion protein IcmT [Rhodospirillaceae bacterium]|tara:strand:+ start:112 stop:402 length:291 start_codon:yes stop_codon:yes gene_type:complete